MIFTFGSLAASTPYLAATLFTIVAVWMWAAKDLNILFTAYEKEKEKGRLKAEMRESFRARGQKLRVKG